MKTSKWGLELIKIFEGVRLEAYLILGEKYYTIGYGHSGTDVKQGQKITMDQAENYLKEDLKKFEASVDSAVKTKKLIFQPDQNQFDALVSFTYNCGTNNLHKLVKDRSAQTVADKMLLYCNGANPKVKAGLLERRIKERALFLGDSHQMPPVPVPKSNGQSCMKVAAAKGLNLREKPDVNGKCLMSLVNGSNVTVTNKSNQEWYQVLVTGKKGQKITGYCNARYLK